MKFKGAFYSTLISPTLVPELNQMELTNDGLAVGAAVTLGKLAIKLKELQTTLPEQKTRTFAALLEMLRWFAGQQIRNVSVSVTDLYCKVRARHNILFKPCRLLGVTFAMPVLSLISTQPSWLLEPS